MLIVKYFYEKPRFVETYCVKDNSYRVSELKKISKKPLRRLTACGIYNSETNVLQIGVALCSPQDIFKKKEGAKLAYNRALTNPVVEVELLEGEHVSDIFFEQARFLCRRYDTLDTVKF